VDLHKMADRIQARAVRRCGQLLKEIAPSTGGRPPKTKTKAGAPPRSRQAGGRGGGPSGRPQKTAIRVANIPEADFQKAVESPNPPTVTELAERGTEKSTAPTPPKRITKVCDTFVAAAEEVATWAEEIEQRMEELKDAPENYE